MIDAEMARLHQKQSKRQMEDQVGAPLMRLTLDRAIEASCMSGGGSTQYCFHDTKVDSRAWIREHYQKLGFDITIHHVARTTTVRISWE